MLAAATLVVGVSGSAVAAPPVTTIPAASYSEAAYPQTRPKAGQYCKRIHRGVVTTAANGRLVRCTPEGSRQRWRYVL